MVCGIEPFLCMFVGNFCLLVEPLSKLYWEVDFLDFSYCMLIFRSERADMPMLLFAALNVCILHTLSLTMLFTNNLQSNLHITVSALVAAAVVWMSELPARLNPIILPLMASIKREQVTI